MPKCLCLKAREEAADLRPEFQHNCFHHHQIQFNRWSSERAWSKLPNCPCLYLYLYYFPCICTCDSSVQNRERSDQSDSIFICVCKCHRHLHLYLFPQLYGFVFVYIFQICTVIASTRYNSSKDHRGRPDLTEGAPIRCWYQTFISVVFSFSLVTCILIFTFFVFAFVIVFVSVSVSADWWCDIFILCSLLSASASLLHCCCIRWVSSFNILRAPITSAWEVFCWTLGPECFTQKSHWPLFSLPLCILNILLFNPHGSKDWFPFIDWQKNQHVFFFRPHWNLKSTNPTFLLNLTRAPVAGLRERAEAEMWPATVLAPSSASTASAVEGSLLRWTRPSFQCEEVGCWPRVVRGKPLSCGELCGFRGRGCLPGGRRGSASSPGITYTASRKGRRSWQSADHSYSRFVWKHFCHYCRPLIEPCMPDHPSIPEKQVLALAKSKSDGGPLGVRDRLVWSALLWRTRAGLWLGLGCSGNQLSMADWASLSIHTASGQQKEYASDFWWLRSI